MLKRFRIPVAAVVVGLVLTLSCTALAAGLIRTESKTVHYRDIKVTVDGRATTPDVVPFIVDPGWVMVPAEFMSKEMGAFVTWDDATSTLAITSKATEATTVGSEVAAVEGTGSVPAGMGMDVQGVVAKVSASVVLVTTLDASGHGLAQGSGVVVSGNRIATNLHVVAGASKVTVIDSKGVSYNCPGVVAVDELNDLALLSCQTNLAPVTLGASLRVAVGEQVVAIGSPRGLQGTVSDGVVSAVRNIDGRPFIQTTAPISPGSSGGGLFNMLGSLLGITTAQYEGQNLNLAVPTADLATLMGKPMVLAAFPPALTPAEESGSTVTFTWADGAKYEGQVDEFGKAHGFGKYTWPNGSFYEGTYDHGVRSGIGTYEWADGEVYIGTWYDGVRNGIGETTFPNGDKYVGYYIMDYRHGLGTYTWADGDKVQGEWKLNQVDGAAIYTWADGSKFVGEYREGMENGLGAMMWPDGHIEGGTWINGKRTSSATK